jgi:putative ABC transport system ATP-binding protein
MVKLINAAKFYNKKDKNVVALNDVTCEFEKGSFVSVVGRSGSGKSTLLNLIGGLDSISSGKIIFDGKPLNEMTKKELEIHRRFSIGMIFQSFNLIPYRSAIDNVILPMVFGNIPHNKRKQIAISHLENVGLKDRMNHIPAEMSGGEAQRVAIARALANNPSLILADEPTGNLDSATSDEIINLLVDLNKNQNISIIMITHESDIALRISDKIITLLDGKIINTLYPSKLRSEHETL